MKNTIIKEIDSTNIDVEAIELYAGMIKDGKTVIFPTETVYGLGANALDESAAMNIYSAKGRPSDNPLIVHICDMNGLEEIASGISDKARLIIDNFWPGPITLIFSKKSCVPYATTGGLETVAVRMPSHPVARELIRLSGVPIAAPSANISGKPSPTRQEHIICDMDGRVDGIILGGACDVGLESTVIDIRGEVPVVLRPGGITTEQLEDLVGRVDIDPALEMPDENITPMSPGMKYKHYSPDAQVYVVSGEKDALAEKINGLCIKNRDEGLKTGVICMKEDIPAYRGCEILSLGISMEDAANNLFDALIEMDKRKVDIVYAQSFEETGIGKAIMNRLLKSAGYRIINA
ncbi:L-threonylcarbamoyladenylate synthase [Peptoclostridium litorale DSM 5388]|uniref:Threonylcarbamoyl-AMP synthase n=1 Tax=Peptoclostridium litorale DSM 5388 TaxID=1121324 RepID=A0A069RKN9_PEPLI|nr:L-threonylcarbamoyladenylate synthase [Peptoclostridium litorale]KDR94802.1 threonylcarbamoyl-AMP synthase Sua [Peptoclostridium litorale DSM 5388]SIN93012.1 L-threonylcarbamoyladenylate synthase [Peptoclostridium litorale DSM 5388]